jgi:ectoine hydroxylase-related dioxygenase (phytanoyl-CoA dioxygenase family)
MNELVEGSGYVIVNNLIPYNILDDLYNKLDKTYPVRASSSLKQYAEKENIKDLQDISVWWSQLVTDWYEVQQINKLVEYEVFKYLKSALLYASDIVFLKPKSTWVNPHIDTPHRFKKYNYNKELLGIQCIIPFFDLDENNGATGLVPSSQLKDFSIKLCYQGYYDNYFMQHCIRPKLNKGDILLYNCRLLHSSMPNDADMIRPALLLNYLDSNIISEVKVLDNIWDSNN